MEKIKLIIKIIIQILVVIIMYMFLDKVLNDLVAIKWVGIIIFALIILYLDLKEVEIKPTDDSKELFNTYYINYPKVFEIAMLINNKIKINAEESIKKQKGYKQSYGIESSFNTKKLPIKGDLGGEYSELTNHEYKEIQEIKNTNSTYLREILKKCKKVENLKDLQNGDLVKIDNVKLKIWNNEEILQANSIISGAFNGNTVDTYSDGQAFKINVNSLTNMILKDYKYYLMCTKGKEKFYIDIPMKAEKEFENEYSIYDLEIGLVNIIGIYRTEYYDPENKTTYSKLQELGNKQNIEIDEMKSSRETKENRQESIKLGKAPYIDLIAIIQDLSFENGD
jgi:hypothetical protein